MLESRKNDLQNLNHFDLYWCLMPLSKEELEKVEKSHQIRPYLIIKKTKNGLLGFYGTSKFHYDDNLLFHTLYNGDYKDLYKNTYFNLDKVYEIPESNVREEIGSLNETDTLEIREKINTTYNLTETKKLKVGYCVVDNVDNLYYIYAIDDDLAYGFLLNETDNLNYTIKINEKKYQFDLLVEKKFKKLSNLKVVYMANIGRMISINKMLTNYYASDEIKNLQKGDIVLNNNKLFYIYNVDCKNAYGIEVSKEANDGDFEIIVNEKYYYTKFSNPINFDHKCNLKIVNRATYKQQETINNLKKEIDEKNKKQQELFETILKGICLCYNIAKKGMVFNKDGIDYVYIYSENDINYCINLNTYLENSIFTEFNEIPITYEYIDKEKLKVILNYMNKNIVRNSRKHQRTKNRIR